MTEPSEEAFAVAEQIVLGNQGVSNAALIIDAALAAAREDERAKVWQPIETAPRDGTLIDVWIDGEFPGRRTDVSWREPTDSEWWVHGGDTIETPDATWIDEFGPMSKCQPPTHWMPLPSPPTP